jgi:hypothetical protein
VRREGSGKTEYFPNSGGKKPGMDENAALVSLIF